MTWVFFWKEFTKFLLGSSIGCCARFFVALIGPDARVSSVDAKLYKPLAGSRRPVDVLVAGSIVAGHASVKAVGGFSRDPKVAEAVVGWVLILMVNVVRRVAAGHPLPHNSVNKKQLAIHRNIDVALGCFPSRLSGPPGVKSVRLRRTTFPKQNADLGIIVEHLLEAFLGWQRPEVCS